MRFAAPHQSRSTRWLAAALVALSVLSLVTGAFGGSMCDDTPAVVLIEREDAVTAATTTVACRCRSCSISPAAPHEKDGKSCCCLTGRSSPEGVTLRALCDRGLPSVQAVAFVKVALPVPPLVYAAPTLGPAPLAPLPRIAPLPASVTLSPASPPPQFRLS